MSSTRCSVCAEARYAGPLDPASVEQAVRYLRSRPVEVEAKEMAPDAAGTMRKIPEEVRVDPGWSLARFGDGGWWPAVARGLDTGEFDVDVVQALADVVRGSGAGWVTSVPSTSLGGALVQLGERVAAELDVPHIELLERREARPPQREMANAVQQAANVRGAFRVTGTPPASTGVLLDDRRHSGWTLAMVGGLLRRAGAPSVVPLVLGTLA